MVFSSVTFLLYFFPIVLLLYFALPSKNTILFLSSIFFYAWGELHFAALLLISIFLNYIFGILIDQSDGSKKQNLFLALGVICNISLIGYFKYANFLVENLNEVLHWSNLAPVQFETVHLPLGISFFTFQAISYLVDVYRGVSPVVKNPIDLGLYISMFPQLIAGPIVRFNHVADQIHNRSIGLDEFSNGVRRFVVGLAQKMLVANVMAITADAIFELSSEYLTFGLAWIGGISYTLQIYYDFAGYSNMAIGLGLMFGFHFPENFNYPYISKSITEFWRRWHISLSVWFRDYLYIPMGGNRLGINRTYLNLFLVFFLCGLWHGAAWTFIVWGLYHGTFLVVERVGFKAWIDDQLALIRHLYLLVVVVIGWVIFRSESISQAMDMISAMCGIAHGDGEIYTVKQYLTLDFLIVFPVSVVFSIPLLSIIGKTDFLSGNRKIGKSLIVQRISVTGAAILGLFFILFWTGYNLAANTHNPFIYFRF